jgi:uncharacterized protein
VKTSILSQEQARKLAELCDRYRVRRLGLFGSAATGAFDPSRSDIDLTVEFDPPVGMGLAEQYFGFQSEATELLGREVDLLERPAIRNPYLRRAIEEQEVLLYVA